MARQSDLYVSKRPIRELLAYEKLMQGKSDTVTLDGKTFVYPTKSSSPPNDDNYQIADNEATKTTN